MDDVLSQDMIDAMSSIALNSGDRELLRGILFQERSNKDREWDDDAVDSIVRLLEVGATD